MIAAAPAAFRSERVACGTRDARRQSQRVSASACAFVAMSRAPVWGRILYRPEPAPYNCSRLRLQQSLFAKSFTLKLPKKHGVNSATVSNLRWLRLAASAQKRSLGARVRRTEPMSQLVEPQRLGHAGPDSSITTIDFCQSRLTFRKHRIHLDVSDN